MKVGDKLYCIKNYYFTDDLMYFTENMQYTITEINGHTATIEVNDNETRKFNLQEKFTIKKQLCPEIWNNFELDDILRKKLIRIATDFFNDLELDTQIIDILLVGSITNYNYTIFSDIDLHIIVDFEDVDKNVALLKRAIDGQRFMWNIRHNIILRGHDVEIYVQDKSEVNVSAGIFSLLKNKWISKPEYKEPVVNMSEVKIKYDAIVADIKRLELLSKHDNTPEESEDYYNYVKELKSKIMKARKEGLAANGEYSVENLVFKRLRNYGKIQKIINLSGKFYDEIFAQ